LYVLGIYFIYFSITMGINVSTALAVVQSIKKRAEEVTNKIDAPEK